MKNTLSYKNYVGTVEFSEEDKVFFGKVVGIPDSISFEGDTVESLIADFHEAVDEYLEFCRENGKEPQQQYKGSFNIRIAPELHRKASLDAMARNMSLNSYVEEAIEMRVTHNAAL
ncbi:MAG: type II toxin-antitoxin system HicB family antitoxin [Clostridia bacterium]|nr:type II toxin-antitoxin system HicB family antitoxin [Clostridia bacterium]